MPACTLALTLLATVLSTCALGLDFGTLSNECLPPRFDLPTSETFCRGELVAGTPYLPPGPSLDDGFTLFPLVATAGQYLATASVSFVEDSRGCTLVSPGIDVARLEDDGSITHVGGVIGRERGLSFVLAGCPDGLLDVWPVEVAIVDTTPFVHVVASFAQAGLLDVQVDPGLGVSVFSHIGGSPNAPTQRECVLGACVTRVGQPCRQSGECHPAAYCGDGGCQALDRCTFDAQCGEGSGQRCATRRGLCALECSDDFECPHPFPCVAGLCGGGGCSTDLACLAGNTLCVEGACLSRCGSALSCPNDESCFQSTEADFVCATSPGGRFGGCSDDTHCSLGAAYGFASVPPNALLSFNLESLLLGTLDNLRLAAFIPGLSSPYVLPPTEATQVLPGSYTDLEYVGSIGSVYIALATGAIVRFDWDDVTAANIGQPSAYTTSYTLELGAGTRLMGLRQVGGYLVTLEAVSGGMGEATPQYARVLVLNNDPTNDLRPAFDGVFELGDAIQSSFGTLEGRDEIWVFGLDREQGGELAFYDMGDPSQPALLGTLPTGDTVAGELQFPNITEAGIFVTDSRGVTPYFVTVETSE